MSGLERILIWLGGYRPSNLTADSPEDREAIGKLGGAVLFSTMVALLNWAIAGWTYAAGVGMAPRLFIAAVTAAIGACMAALFDRSFIYFADTSLESNRLTLIAYGLARVTIIIAIASLTSQVVMPLLLNSELKTYALHMMEASEKTRIDDLDSRYHIAEKEADMKTATKKVESLRLAASALPLHIERKILAARACWADYSAEKSSLLTQGYSLDEVRANLSANQRNCSARSALANAERRAYFSRIRVQLAQALKDRGAKENEYAESRSAIDSKVQRAERIESQGYNPRSSTVLWAMIKSNPGALGKWAFITFVLLVLELLPLILKFQAGQSNVGLRIAHSRTERRIQLDEQLKQHEHDFAISSAVSEISKNAANEAMLNPDVKDTFATAFAANISAFAPPEAVRAMMRNIEERNVDVTNFMHRYPKFASVIAQAWSQAIKNTAEILGGFGTGKAN